MNVFNIVGAKLRACFFRHVCVCMHACLRTYAYTYTHTHTHWCQIVCIYTYTYTMHTNTTKQTLTQRQTSQGMSTYTQTHTQAWEHNTHEAWGEDTRPTRNHALRDNLPSTKFSTQRDDLRASSRDVYTGAAETMTGQPRVPARDLLSRAATATASKRDELRMHAQGEHSHILELAHRPEVNHQEWSDLKDSDSDTHGAENVRHVADFAEHEDKTDLQLCFDPEYLTKIKEDASCQVCVYIPSYHVDVHTCVCVCIYIYIYIHDL